MRQSLQQQTGNCRLLLEPRYIKAVDANGQTTNNVDCGSKFIWSKQIYGGAFSARAGLGSLGNPRHRRHLRILSLRELDGWMIGWGQRQRRHAPRGARGVSTPLAGSLPLAGLAVALANQVSGQKFSVFGFQFSVAEAEQLGQSQHPRRSALQAGDVAIHAAGGIAAAGGTGRSLAGPSPASAAAARKPLPRLLPELRPNHPIIRSSNLPIFQSSRIQHQPLHAFDGAVRLCYTLYHVCSFVP